jgi:adenosyl cobinamide kinase/adenosyl cobinamide phosphate guanylyltransferase
VRDLVLLLGGVRSGKSAAAVRLAATTGRAVTFVATSQPGDGDMRRRIARHRSERPSAWATIEAPEWPGRAVRQVGDSVIIVDCVTVWVSNLLLRLDALSDDAVEAEIDAQVDDLLAARESGAGQLIVVSNEVGLGVVPPYPLGRRFRDLLGHVNRRLAAEATEVTLMIAGIPVPIGQFRVAQPDR